MALGSRSLQWLREPEMLCTASSGLRRSYSDCPDKAYRVCSIGGILERLELADWGKMGQSRGRNVSLWLGRSGAKPRNLYSACQRNSDHKMP